MSMERETSKRRRLLDTSGSVSTMVVGAMPFAIGVGLTLFVIVNPMKVGLFERAKQAIMPQAAGTTLAPSAQTTSRKIKYWRAPMDPTFISDKPGKSPMGMDLIPVYEDEAASADDNAVRIDPATVQNIGVVSQTVKRGDLRVEVRTVGNIDYNQNRIYWVNNKYDGWIEKAYVNYVGQTVHKGEPLFEIYSPDLVSTQEEYLSALKYRDKMKDSGFPDAEAGASSLLAASQNRLRYWDISDQQIQTLEEKRQIKKTLTVVSPVTGVVTEKMDEALEGMYAKAGMNLYKIADLSSLWVYVDVYEYQLPWIKPGQEVKVECSYYPGETFKGKVLFFNPHLDEKTRTIRVNLEMPNKDGKMHPQMFATVTFSPVAAKNAVIVPESAVLHSGERDVVVLDLGNGRFEPRDVKLGLQGEGMYQVLEGLEGGEKIVTSSQFLIDSESNLREAINKMLMAKNGGTATDVPVGSATSPTVTKDTQHGLEPKKLEQDTAAKDMEHAENQMKAVIKDPQTVSSLTKVLNAYEPIWKALAADSTAGLKDKARELASAAGDAAHQAQEEMLKTQLESVQKKATEMNTGSLEAARESMKGLSRSLIAIFEMYEVKLPKKYTIIECPMVKERWIQDTEQVSNPYLGSSMPTCGVKVGEIG